MSIEIRREFQKPIKRVSDGAFDFGNGVIGPSPEDRHTFNNGLSLGDTHAKQLMYSAFLGGTSQLVYKGTETLIILGGITVGHMGDLITAHPHQMLAGAMAADILTAVISGYQNFSLMKNRKIGFSPNFYATSGYYASEELMPKRKTVKKISTVFLPRLFSKDWGLVALALVKPEYMIGVVTAKTATTVLNLTQAGIARIVLETIGREKKIKEEAVNTVPEVILEQ